MTGSVPYPQEYDVLKIGTSFFFSMDRKKKLGTVPHTYSSETLPVSITV
jgi:hypothetical protein